MNPGPDLVAQRLETLLCKLKVPGWNPTVDKSFHFVILGLHS